MKLIDKQHKHPPFDAPAGMAESLISAGTAERYVEPTPKKLAPSSSWRVVEDPMYANDGVHTYRCYILATCSTCGGAMRAAGPTAHRTQTFRHCGVNEEVPQDIRREYERILRQPVDRVEEKQRKRQERPGLLVPANW